MKTAIQELVEMKKRLSMNEFDTWLLSNIEILLEKEKEQIRKANLDGYVEGCKHFSFGTDPITSEQYYYKNYNQNK